jgi:hypothetical protein
LGADAGSSIFDGQNALDQTLTGRGAAALASVMQNNALTCLGLSDQELLGSCLSGLSC